MIENNQEINYKKNFLTNVIFKIDFSRILKLENDIPKEFQDKIKDEFPILEELPQEGFELNNLQGDNLIAKKLKKVIWRFYTKDKKQVVELDSGYLLINFLNYSYSSFSMFKATVERVLSIFNEIYNPAILNKVGLRYINEIKIDESDFYNWKNYLNLNLIQFINFLEKEEDLIRCINSYIIKSGEESLLNFKYGIFNSSFPGEVVSKEFILDYNCYQKGQIEKEEVLKILDNNHKKISELFEKSIEDGLREVLRK